MSELVQAASKAAVRQGNPSMKELLQAQSSAIKTQLAGALNSEAFTRAALSEISASKELQACDPKSVLGSVMLAAQLKLEIGKALGQFWLVPFKGQCTPIIGYQGMIELAYRSGRVEKIESFLVREGDMFEVGGNSERGTFFDWQPADQDENRPWTHAVAVAKIKGAGTVWRSLTKQQVLKRGTGRGPWKTHEEEMAKKTAVRALAPYMPKSTEFAVAVEKARQVEEEGRVVVKRDGLDDLDVIEAEVSDA